MSVQRTGDLVRSRQRVADHGEVFTPSWLVDDMLDLVGDVAERIDARVLEPACESGNFLVPALKRKLRTVHRQYVKSRFEKRQHALHALMCLYGIELLADNAAECRANLLAVFTDFLKVTEDDKWAQAARVVVAVNIVQGDALSLTVPNGDPITFSEWSHLGKGRFQRRDFHYCDLSRAAFTGVQPPLLGEQQLFVPVKEWPLLTVQEIAS